MTQPTRPKLSHQAAANAAARGHAGFGYLMETGCGKSKTLVDEAWELFEAGEIDHILLVAGKGSYQDWREKHLPENWPSGIQYIAHLWTGGNTAQERARVNALVDLDLPGPRIARVLIMNTESFSAGQWARTVALNFIRAGRTLMCVDESSKIKHENAACTVALTDVGQHARYRRIMTGTPVTRSPLDVWSQAVFLGEHLAHGYHAFRARYAVVKKKITGIKDARLPKDDPKRYKTAKIVVGYKNLDELARRLEKFTYRVLKKDCLDLPPKTYRKRRVELTPEQCAAYTEMRDIGTIELDSGAWASAQMAVTRVMRLHQVCCGYVRDETGVLHELPSNRPAALIDELEETSGGVIIWCGYRPDVERVLAALRRHYPEERVVRYDGATSTEDRATGVRDFQAGAARFFVGTQATGGYGITLTAASTVIYYSNDRSLEHRLQSEDRAHRVGQTQSVTYIDLVAPGTVDEKIIQTFRDQKELADVVCGDQAEAWLKWES